MATAEQVAEQVMKKASEVLAPLERMMVVMGWPQEYRSIMWQAVADLAAQRARGDDD